MAYNPYQPYQQYQPFNPQSFNYQPYGQPQQQYQQSSPPANTNKIFVSGIEDVKARALTPNSDFIFIDNDQDILYQKKVDASGHYEIKAFSISELNNAENCSTVDLSNFVTKQQFEDLANELDILRKQLEK